MGTTVAHKAAIKNETASNGIDKATSKKESAKRKTSRSIGPSGDLACASQAGAGAGGEVDGFTMILPGSYADRSALAAASVASLALRWTCTVTDFAGDRFDNGRQCSMEIKPV